jgi:hypothetical protein
MDTVRFTAHRTEDTYSFSVRTDGLLRLEEEGRLIIEFREKRTNLGTGKSTTGPLQTVEVPLEQVSEIVCERAWFGFVQRLRITTRSMRALDGLSIADGNEVVIPIGRRGGDTARNLAALVANRLADAELRRLRGD